MMTQTCKTSKGRRRSGPDLCACLPAALFKALSEPCRITLLAHLARMKKPLTVSQAAACCPTDLSVVSRHLATLRDAGILQAEKRGKEVFYAVLHVDLAETLRAMADAIEACCPAQTAPRKKSPKKRKKKRRSTP